MDKPEITSGEWVTYCPPTNASVQVKGVDNLVCTLYNDVNAKAIAKVPEMLDELIDTYERLRFVFDYHMHEHTGEMYETKQRLLRIEQLLLDAGCVHESSQPTKGE